MKIIPMNTDARSIVDMVYPVGSYYWSSNATNPSSIFGGTWEQVKDKFVLAAGDTYETGSTGGEAQHTLTVDEMPRHYHDEQVGDGSTQQVINPLKRRENNGVNSGSIIESSWKSTGLGINIGTVPTGGSKPHNNMPPYITAYCWHRTA